MVKNFYFLIFIGLYAIASQYTFDIQEINTIPKNVLQNFSNNFDRKAFDRLNFEDIADGENIFAYDKKNCTGVCIYDVSSCSQYAINFCNSKSLFKGVYQDNFAKKPFLVGVNKNVILMMKKGLPSSIIEVPEVINSGECCLAVEVVFEQDKNAYVYLNQEVQEIYPGEDGQFYLKRDTGGYYLLTIKEKSTIFQNSTVEKNNDLQKATNNVSRNPKKSLSHLLFAISGLGIVACGIVFFIIQFKSKFLSLL